ncbi:unnamed protein product, partial [Rangifer tarandus platyrhynchus]
WPPPQPSLPFFPPSFLLHVGPWLPHGMWNLPGPGIEPLSITLTGRFLSTVLPGKFSQFLF